MASWAKVGAKCVCIDARWESWHSACPLRVGAVYTVVAVGRAAPNAGPFAGECDTVTLAEVSNPTSYIHGDGFAVARFRPVITKTQAQDVEMFLRLASPSPLERLDLIAERLNELAED